MDLKLWKNICFTDHILDATVGKLVSWLENCPCHFFLLFIEEIGWLAFGSFCSLCPSLLFIYLFIILKKILAVPRGMWDLSSPTRDRTPPPTHPRPPNTGSAESFFFFFDLFLLCWVFIAVRGLSLVAVSGGYSSLQCAGFSLSWLLLWSTGSRCTDLSSCGMWAQ